MGTYNHVILNWLHSNTDYSLTQRLKEAADFFLCGSAAAVLMQQKVGRSRLIKRPKPSVSNL